MSQSNTGQAQIAETSTQATKTFIRQVRTKTRRRYAPEDKIRIVLEGFRRELTVSDLCRREGIKPGVFYAWTKEFMEAGKERLTRDTVRDATRQEIEHLKRENHDGRTTTGEPRSEAACCRPFPRGPPHQKNSHPSLRRKYGRMSAEQKSEVLARVEETKWGKRKLLAQLQVRRSTY